MKIKNRLKLLLIGEESLISYFFHKELRLVAAGAIGLAYLPIVFLAQIYLALDIYFKISKGVEATQQIMLISALTVLAVVYFFYIHRLKKRKKKLEKAEKQIEDLPQVFLNALLQGLKSERDEFLKK